MVKRKIWPIVRNALFHLKKSFRNCYEIILISSKLSCCNTHRLLYGCEIWPMRVEAVRKLFAFDLFLMHHSYPPRVLYYIIWLHLTLLKYHLHHEYCLCWLGNVFHHRLKEFALIAKSYMLAVKNEENQSKSGLIKWDFECIGGLACGLKRWKRKWLHLVTGMTLD